MSLKADKKYNIIFTLQGPGGTAIAPNTTNPVAAQDMKELLERLAANFPELNFDLEIVGLAIHEASA